MVHPLVRQLRFTRNEFRRAFAGVSDADARRRFPPMNCIAWNVGHMAWQEQRYWLWRGQGRMLRQAIQDEFAYGAPGTTPALDEMSAAWTEITGAADAWLDALTTAALLEPHPVSAKPDSGTFTFGNLLQRVIYHYWYHTGENMAIRQLLGHGNLPEYVGDIDGEAPYTTDGS